jgi:hypothetical protein
MGDAIQGDGGVQLSEDGVYVGGGEKFAGGSGSEEITDAFGFEELAVYTRVMDAVLGMVPGAGHAAVAAVGETEAATSSGRDSCGARQGSAREDHDGSLDKIFLERSLGWNRLRDEKLQQEPDRKIKTAATEELSGNSCRKK